jgi:transcription initiation factor TFIIIB Brf1 subunit/transcription initiation factor TFIIB
MLDAPIQGGPSDQNFDECCYCQAKNNIVSDPESAERISSTCGVVVAEHQTDGILLNSYSENFQTVHSGLPCSLAHHDNHLSTLISFSSGNNQKYQ